MVIYDSIILFRPVSTFRYGIILGSPASKYNSVSLFQSVLFESMMQSVIGCLPINYNTSSEIIYQSGGSSNPGCSFVFIFPTSKSPLLILFLEIEFFYCNFILYIKGYLSIFTLLAAYSNYVVGEISILSKGGFSRVVLLGTTDGLSLSSSIVWCLY